MADSHSWLSLFEPGGNPSHRWRKLLKLGQAWHVNMVGRRVAGCDFDVVILSVPWCRYMRCPFSFTWISIPIQMAHCETKHNPDGPSTLGTFAIHLQPNFSMIFEKLRSTRQNLKATKIFWWSSGQTDMSDMYGYVEIVGVKQVLFFQKILDAWSKHWCVLCSCLLFSGN